MRKQLALGDSDNNLTVSRLGKIDFDAAIRKTEADSKETIEKIMLLKTIEGIDKLMEEDVKRVMSVTCFGLAYCCGLEKACFWRDSALQALRISPSKFKEMKARFTKELIDFSLKE